MKVRMLSKDTDTIHEYSSIARVRIEKLDNRDVYGIYYVLEREDGTNSYCLEEWDIQVRKEINE